MLWDICTKAVEDAMEDDALEEVAVVALKEELTALEARRHEILELLAKLSWHHIEVSRFDRAKGFEGDADLFHTYSKARLMEIIEQHWHMHHMGAISHLENHTKTELINIIIAIKGLDGQAPSKPKPVRQTGHRRGRGSDSPLMV